MGSPYLPQTLPVKGVGLDHDGRVRRSVGISSVKCAIAIVCDCYSHATHGGCQAALGGRLDWVLSTANLESQIRTTKNNVCVSLPGIYMHRVFRNIYNEASVSDCYTQATRGGCRATLGGTLTAS